MSGVVRRLLERALQGVDGSADDQQVVVVVQPRQGGELIVRLESFGDPIVTATVRGAVHAVTEWVLEQPGLTLKSRFY